MSLCFPYKLKRGRRPCGFAGVPRGAGTWFPGPASTGPWPLLQPLLLRPALLLVCYTVAPRTFYFPQKAKLFPSSVFFSCCRLCVEDPLTKILSLIPLFYSRAPGYFLTRLQTPRRQGPCPFRLSYTQYLAQFPTHSRNSILKKNKLRFLNTFIKKLIFRHTIQLWNKREIPFLSVQFVSKQL